jgi:transcriptional regulator with XRE-family HTH domain
MSSVQSQPVGNVLPDWRKRRHLSQLDLACEAEISTRHLSFLETGRSQPSREMLLHLAEQLANPLAGAQQLAGCSGLRAGVPGAASWRSRASGGAKGY